MAVDRGASRGKTPRITWGAGFANALVFAQPLDEAVSYPEATLLDAIDGMAGDRDGWATRPRGVLEGVVRGVPRIDTAGVTGWEGPTGWAAFLTWARDLTPFRWIPDAAVPAVYVVVSLLEPWEEAPDVEPSRAKTFRLVMETVDQSDVTGY